MEPHFKEDSCNKQRWGVGFCKNTDNNAYGVWPQKDVLYIVVKYCSKLFRPIVTILEVLSCVAGYFICTQCNLFKGTYTFPGGSSAVDL